MSSISRIRPAVAAAAFAVGVAVYGIDVSRAWVQALANVTWAYAVMNASLQGVLARAMTMPGPSSVPLVVAPVLVAPLARSSG